MIALIQTYMKVVWKSLSMVGGDLALCHMSVKF